MADNGAQSIHAPSLHVLIIDDESGIRVTLSACLEADGHHVTAVPTDPKALAATTLHAFDLIFLDLVWELTTAWIISSHS